MRRQVEMRYKAQLRAGVNWQGDGRKGNAGKERV
jgi:hypothetical protein